ncbi:hypothetical protein K439DRAFT_1374755, partial [Ramaria rubella]
PNAHISPPGWFQLFILDGSTPSWSQWVRIGGDPAVLGYWPQFLNFTTPDSPCQDNPFSQSALRSSLSTLTQRHQGVQGRPSETQTGFPTVGT